MLEFLAAGGQSIAIIILCYTCWMVGQSSRRSARQTQSVPQWSLGEPPRPAETSDLPDAARMSSTEGDARPVRSSERLRRQTHAKDLEAERAAQVYALIKSADLSQEGVLESLVAMAEEHAERDAAAALCSWGSSSHAALASESCDQARILTRKVATPEPLPADLADPLTPQVLARYRMYAQECS